MKKMLVALLVLNFSSLAGAELAGEYIAEGRQGLECAFPDRGYTLNFTQVIAEADTGGGAERTIAVKAFTPPGFPYFFNCEVNYEGSLTYAGDRVYGGLERTRCWCEDTDPGQAEAVCARQVDPYLVEAEGVEVVISAQPDGFRYQQLGTTRTPCGDRFPNYYYKAK